MIGKEEETFQWRYNHVRTLITQNIFLNIGIKIVSRIIFSWHIFNFVDFWSVNTIYFQGIFLVILFKKSLYFPIALIVIFSNSIKSGLKFGLVFTTLLFIFLTELGRNLWQAVTLYISQVFCFHPPTSFLPFISPSLLWWLNCWVLTLQLPSPKLAEISYLGKMVSLYSSQLTLNSLYLLYYKVHRDMPWSCLCIYT